jgi:large subunit ribosomal protein L23
MEPHRVIQAPLITEKASAATEKVNQVVFRVHPGARKIDIRRAVETLFKVRVVEVRTCHYSGKEKKVGRNLGRKADWKKAYVTLNPADKIDFFGTA